VALRRVLVANRGEIARRVIRACHDEGLEAVAVHSEVDAGAPFVAEADQAVLIGPGPAPRSYLDVGALLEAARRTGADAVHPGYGFLSESARFAAAVAAAGLTWVGPPAEVIAAMGDKVAARAAMRAAGVPVVPGTDGALGPDEDVAATAAAVGFPLMVKARAGGGGIGMQRVDDPAALERAVATARQRAAAAFGDGGLFLERFVDGPRHVELQVLADAHGNAVHLGERECSVQRRHQKVIEESPSCALNAGTVEFLVDAAGGFHFLEMNTRLQVEHPVTEMRTGVDIVRLQLRIAAGEPLGLTQDGVTFDGHAIEMRVYAEDPYRMLPSPGTITAWREPSGPGIRVDSGVVEGSVVSHLYDPLLAKLIVHAPTREAALDLALEAVDGFAVEGVRTNLALHRHVLTSAPFRAGEYTTALLEVIGPVPRPVPAG
jgi:acetyl/propionyl-CoA carboxylase alpha subunit